MNIAVIGVPTPQPYQPGQPLYHAAASYPANRVIHTFIYAVQDANQLTLIVNSPGAMLQTFPASEMEPVERRKVSPRP